jgi:hypothetical protein
MWNQKVDKYFGVHSIQMNNQQYQPICKNHKTRGDFHFEFEEKIVKYGT